MQTWHTGSQTSGLGAEPNRTKANLQLFTRAHPTRDDRSGLDPDTGTHPTHCKHSITPFVDKYGIGLIPQDINPLLVNFRPTNKHALFGGTGVADDAHKTRAVTRVPISDEP